MCRSKCPSYVGVEGILLQETQNTLHLIAKDNKIRSKGVGEGGGSCGVRVGSYFAIDIVCEDTPL